MFFFRFLLLLFLTTSFFRHCEDSEFAQWLKDLEELKPGTPAYFTGEVDTFLRANIQYLCGSGNYAGVTMTHWSLFLFLTKSTPQVQGRKRRHTSAKTLCNAVTFFFARMGDGKITLPTRHHLVADALRLIKTETGKTLNATKDYDIELFLPKIISFIRSMPRCNDAQRVQLVSMWLHRHCHGLRSKSVADMCPLVKNIRFPPKSLTQFWGEKIPLLVGIGYDKVRLSLFPIPTFGSRLLLFVTATKERYKSTAGE